MKTLRQKRVTAGKGKNAKIVLSVRRYNRLLEDLHDLAVVAERRDDPSLSQAALKTRLRKRGLL